MDPEIWIEDVITGSHLRNALWLHGITTTGELMRLLIRDDWTAQIRNIGERGKELIEEAVMGLIRE